MRREGPVTIEERVRKAGIGAGATTIFFAVVVAVQAARSRPLEGSDWLAAALTLALMTGVGFVFPRHRSWRTRGMTDVLERTDWSKESLGSKVVAGLALGVVVALLVARTVSRFDD